MARVRYLGWVDRKLQRQEHRVVTAGGGQLKKTVNAPDGRRYVFRGRAGRESQPQTVENRATIEYFEEHEDFEVQRP